MSNVSITAMVSGFPPGLRMPKPLPGESLGHVVIRNHPIQWRNCVAYLEDEHVVDAETCKRLRRGELGAPVSSTAQNVIADFMNMQLPTVSRTLKCMSQLRDTVVKLNDHSGFYGFSISRILWPMNKSMHHDVEAEKRALELGIEVPDVRSDEHARLDLEYFMQFVDGDYLWILPGGSTFNSAVAALLLRNVFATFKENPRYALYYDLRYSVIYKTSTLSKLIASGHTLSAELRETARLLKNAGYEMFTHPDPDMNLVQIEEYYLDEGNQSDKDSSRDTGRTSPASPGWLRRLFGNGR